MSLKRDLEAECRPKRKPNIVVGSVRKVDFVPASPRRPNRVQGTQAERHEIGADAVAGYGGEITLEVIPVRKK